MDVIIATAHVPVCEQQHYDTAHASRLRHSRSFTLEDEWALIAASYPSETDELYLNFRTVHAYRKNDYTGLTAAYNMYVRISAGPSCVPWASSGRRRHAVRVHQGRCPASGLA